MAQAVSSCCDVATLRFVNDGGWAGSGRRGTLTAADVTIPALRGIANHQRGRERRETPGRWKRALQHSSRSTAGGMKVWSWRTGRAGIRLQRRSGQAGPRAETPLPNTARNRTFSTKQHREPGAPMTIPAPALLRSDGEAENRDRRRLRGCEPSALQGSSSYDVATIRFVNDRDWAANGAKLGGERAPARPSRAAH
jgi:hypothetical protein